jgi:hypothetical protein
MNEVAFKQLGNSVMITSLAPPQLQRRGELGFEYSNQNSQTLL